MNKYNLFTITSQKAQMNVYVSAATLKKPGSKKCSFSMSGKKIKKTRPLIEYSYSLWTIPLKISGESCHDYE